jgi:hypothetical protein
VFGDSGDELRLGERQGFLPGSDRMDASG